MFCCLKKKKGKVTSSGTMKDIAIVQTVIGHNAKYQGAVNYLGESEFKFGKRISKKVQAKLMDHRIGNYILERPPVKSYSKQVEFIKNETAKIKPDISIHLHFNAYSKKLLGCEAYIFSGGDKETVHKSALMADKFTDLLNERHGFKERYKDGVRMLESGHNGFGMMSAVTPHTKSCILVEPCFANFRTKESEFIFENEDAYVDIIVDTIVYQVKEVLYK